MKCDNICPHLVQLFISYSRKDTEFARCLTDSLATQNKETWADWENIPSSIYWIKEIEKGIKRADVSGCC